MTNQERLVSIFEDDIKRRRELVRISEVAIGLHEDRIAKHQAIIASERSEIERLKLAVVKAQRAAARTANFAREAAE